MILVLQAAALSFGARAESSLGGKADTDRVHIGFDVLHGIKINKSYTEPPGN